VVRESSIEALAGRLGIEPVRLRATVDRFNSFVAKGHDDDFCRGENAFDMFHGDPGQAGALRTLGAIATPPYYAVRIYNGVLGTNGGPAIDSWARVVDVWGEPIPGLYAAGNAAGSGFGLMYPGPGSTLGPGVTWGYAAGRHAMAGQA
jgi:predicted oxidoreductase